LNRENQIYICSMTVIRSTCLKMKKKQSTKHSHTHLTSIRSYYSLNAKKKIESRNWNSRIELRIYIRYQWGISTCIRMRTKKKSRNTLTNLNLETFERFEKNRRPTDSNDKKLDPRYIYIYINIKWLSVTYLVILTRRFSTKPALAGSSPNSIVCVLEFHEFFEFFLTLRHTSKTCLIHHCVWFCVSYGLLCVCVCVYNPI
jgi:hypothetical protein